MIIGCVSGANVLATGPFTGGSMNPPYSFGSALIAGRFRNQAVYWIEPLIGAALAGVVYDNVVLFGLQMELEFNCRKYWSLVDLDFRYYFLKLYLDLKEFVSLSLLLL